MGVACDTVNGDVWIVDNGNFVIRKIDYSTKMVSTIAGQLGVNGAVNGIGTNVQFGFMYHITFNPNNRCFYVADCWNQVIRRITIFGEVFTFAGKFYAQSYLDGVGTLANLNNPVGIAFDPTNGNIVVGDHSNHRIRVIDSATANVITVAGNGDGAPSNGMGTYAKVIHPLP